MKIGLTNIVSCKIGSTQVNRVYIGSTLIWSYSAFDPDAQLFITNAAITEPVQQNAVNNLVINLKNYGIWSKMKALYPFVGGTAAQHKFNLKNPLDTDAAFRLVFNGGWTHSSTGALPNGTNAYANTFFKGGNWTSKDNAHMSYYSRTDFNGSVMIDMGVDDSPSNSNIRSRDGNMTYMAFNGGMYVQAASTNSLGLYMANRVALNTLSGWKNNTKFSQIASTSVTSNTAFYTLAAYNNAILNPANYSVRQCAFSSFGDGLTDTEAANYYTAVQTFQTTLNRQVGVPIVADSDAQAFLNAAVITDTTQASAVNTLVTDLKGYGIWNKMKALYPFVGGTAAQHKFNLKNPLDTDAAFRLTFNGGITHASTGVKGNETNGYFDTFINAATVFSPTSGGSQFVYVRNNIATGHDLGAFAFTPSVSRMYIASKFGASFETAGLSGGYSQFANADSRGFYGITREPNAGNYNSIANTTTYSTTDAYQEPNSKIYGLALIADSGQPLAWSGHELAMACIADGLTLAEAQNLRIANLTFQTTLSRNV